VHTKNLMKTSINTIRPTDAFLKANNEAYEWLVKKTQTMESRVDAEAVLKNIAAAARFAAIFHPGRFADGAIENIAFEIGSKLESDAAEDGEFLLPLARQENRRRILHVATDVLGIGGHTRMLYHWIQKDRGSCHSVLLLNQPETTPIPLWLSDAVKSNGGELLVFPTLSKLSQKAKWLRETAKRIADLVVLHHCPFDVVPTVAFAVQDCPPVAVLNHADHLFWLGSSVADIVINLRTAGSKHTAERRFIKHNTILPIPLVEPAEGLPRKQARLQFGMGEDQCMLLSVGRAEKYRPSGSFDFVATANKILDRQESAHMYVVGETLEGITPYLNYVPHERLHFMGSIEDTSLYLMAADLYLESFPFGSNTALLEAAMRGLPVVPGYAPLFELMGANNDSLLDLLCNPISEEEYLERIDALLRDSDQRSELGAKLRARLLLDHTGDGWLQKLNLMYEETDNLKHKPRSIPAATLSLTNEDIGLSLWHIVANGKDSTTTIPRNLVKAIYCHASFVAKEVGNYASARKNAWCALCQAPFTWATWRLLGISLLGKFMPFIRRYIYEFFINEIS